MDDDMTTRRARSLADLRAAADLATGIEDYRRAALFLAAAAAVTAMPDPARAGIPRSVVDRDTAEALRWSPLFSVITSMAAADLVAHHRAAAAAAATREGHERVTR